MLLVELAEFLSYIYQTCINYILKISANEICRSKGRAKITVKDVMEAIEKAGMQSFQPEIENLLIGNLINYKLIYLKAN